MSRRDPATSLRQMRDGAREIIGEAAERVPLDEQTRIAGIPWASIVALRNRLIHGYDDVDHDIVWQIVTTDVPLLDKRLSSAIPE